MARERRRLLIEPGRLLELSGSHGRLMLQPQEEHYLARVLRLRPGDGIAVIDGCGGLWEAARGEGAWLEELRRCGPGEPASSPWLSLGFALPRQDVELVWRMATELGIDRLQPLLADRCQGHSRREPQERWQAIVREATEQCERLWLPRLEPALPARRWLAHRGEAVGLLATTRRQGLPPLESLLATLGSGAREAPGIALAIGPEGGWSPEEEEEAEAAGWLAVSLGETILRSGTAALAGVSRLVAWRQLSCSACPGPSPGSHPDQPSRDDGPGEGRRRR